MTLLKSYYQLCKPNVVYMMLICAFVGMLLAEESVTSYGYLFVSLLGIALCAASAAAINQVIDRKTDASMTRTDQRPLPQGELSAVHASIFAIAIGVLGALVLYLCVNTLTMILTLASLIGYAFIYTVYLKRATPQNISQGPNKSTFVGGAGPNSIVFMSACVPRGSVVLVGGLSPFQPFGLKIKTPVRSRPQESIPHGPRA